MVFIAESSPSAVSMDSPFDVPSSNFRSGQFAILVSETGRGNSRTREGEGAAREMRERGGERDLMEFQDIQRHIQGENTRTRALNSLTTICCIVRRPRAFGDEVFGSRQCVRMMRRSPNQS
jgi:hypothetical protein